jgi:hypothetical protein
MINEIIVFLGWSTLINFALLSFSSIAIFGFKSFITEIHSKISGISPANLMPIYMQYLGSYKILIIVFNLVPYLALKIMQ